MFKDGIMAVLHYRPEPEPEPEPITQVQPVTPAESPDAPEPSKAEKAEEGMYSASALTTTCCSGVVILFVSVDLFLPRFQTCCGWWGEYCTVLMCKPHVAWGTPIHAADAFIYQLHGQPNTACCSLYYWQKQVELLVHNLELSFIWLWKSFIF